MKTLFQILVWAAAASAQNTVTLGGATYSLKDHPRLWMDGPAGAITTAVKDPDGSGPLKSPRAVNTNPPWAGMVSTVGHWTATDGTYGFAYKVPSNRTAFFDGEAALEAAILWYSDNSQTAAHDMALYLLNNLDQYIPLGCTDLSIDACGAGNYAPWGLYGSFYEAWWMQAFEIMRSEMTPTERQTFAGKILNDIAKWGGTNSNPAVSCVNPFAALPGGVTGTIGTTTLSGDTVTASTPVFGTTILARDWIWIAGNADQAVRVLTVVSPTVALVDKRLRMDTPTTGALWTRRAAWQAGDCGWNWVHKHQNGFPNGISNPTDYPAYGGFYGTSSGYNITHAEAFASVASLVSLIDDDVNAAVRSKAQLSAIYDWFQTYEYQFVKDHWTGVTQSGSGYGNGGWTGMFAPLTAMALTQSLVSAPDLMAGPWAQNILWYHVIQWYPPNPQIQMQWGQQSVDGNNQISQNLAVLPALIYQFANSDASDYALWWLKNVWPWNTGSFSSLGYATRSPMFYLFLDPAAGGASLSGAPTSFAFTSSATGAAPINLLSSRTGYSATSDTLINLWGVSDPQDHGNTNTNGDSDPGSYKIFHRGMLLAEDEGNGFDLFSGGYSGGSNQSNYIEIGGANNLGQSGSKGRQQPRFPRVRTTDSRFAYAMADLTNAYDTPAHAARVHRHFIDFKKPGTTQYVFVYDDAATTQGMQKKTFLHYPNNCQNGEGKTILNGAGVVSTFGDPACANGTTTKAEIRTQVLAPAGANSIAVFTDNANGSYTGGNGQTFRVSVCASANGSTCDGTNTTAEFAVVHQISDGSGNTMPAAGLITTDANHRGVQVDGASPKVALFPRSGATYNGATFTSTHSGTAQIAIAGMAPGSYTINGPVRVAATAGADGLLYLEGPAGAYSITPGNAGKTGLRGRGRLSGKTKGR